ncbi:histidinol-phosphatase [soil metagenome]
MLTDYHVHLRPDDLAATAEDYFTQANAERYLEAATKAGVGALGVAEHIHRFTVALEIWDHPFWQAQAMDDISAYAEFVAETEIKLGLEMDFIPGREDRIASVLDSQPFDFVIGSVHFVGDGAVDDDRYDVWSKQSNPDKLWARYFETMAESASSGLYDVISHPDLIKYWGGARPQPTRDPRFFYEPFVEAVADGKVAVEVSTAGLRKPVAEIYPADELAEMLVDAGAVFALSSDAHEPDHIGYSYEAAVERMGDWGITEIAVFEGRERHMEPLG